MPADLVSDTGPSKLAPHRYKDSRRPLLVFGLAAAAAVGVLLPVWGAHSALFAAIEEERLVDPPDLKSLVEGAEKRGRALWQEVLSAFPHESTRP